MNVHRPTGRYRIGEWDFSLSSGELRRGSEIRRLEPRAAKTLQLLCDARGEVVSQDEVIAAVWNGRALSENSVAVVIGQLRRALDDDSREDRLIETLPKRGYRLRTEVQSKPGRKPRAATALIALLLAAIFAALWLWPGRQQAEMTIAVANTVNETGNARFDPLARATSELIVSELGARGYLVRRSGDADLGLASKIVIWDGLPYLGMTVSDRSGVVRWSSMDKATPGAVPPALDGRLDELAGRFPPK